MVGSYCSLLNNKQHEVKEDPWSTATHMKGNSQKVFKEYVFKEDVKNGAVSGVVKGTKVHKISTICPYGS